MSDLISRQAAIEAVEKAEFKGVAKSAIKSLPPVEPPKKVVAQINVDIDEIVKRIKEEYEIKDRPKGQLDSMPSIDIVHCSECKYYVYDYKGDWWSCSNRHGMGNSSFDDYCSHGERAEQKGESK